MQATVDGFRISNGTATILGCAQGRCFAGSEVISTFMQFAPGLYVGYEPYRENINGVWMAESILRLANPDGTWDRKMKVRLLADATVTGTMTIEGDLQQVELTTGMRIVGNASSSSILANRDWATELVAGNVVINTATFVDSCRPAAEYLNVPPANVNGILEITNYTGTSKCGNFRFQDKTLLVRRVISIAQCYSIVDFPGLDCGGKCQYFKLKSGCGSLGALSLSVTGYSDLTCTGGSFMYDIPLGCAAPFNINIDCYNTH